MEGAEIPGIGLLGLDPHSNVTVSFLARALVFAGVRPAGFFWVNPAKKKKTEVIENMMRQREERPKHGGQ